MKPKIIKKNKRNYIIPIFKNKLCGTKFINKKIVLCVEIEGKLVRLKVI